MSRKKGEDVRHHVRQHYSKVARSQTGCCSGSPCCSPSTEKDQSGSGKIGYTARELESAPEGSDLGLGCGNPQAIADLKPGETVIDLGCGAGLDSFLAARQVGTTGRVIGIDMTAEMIAKARENAQKGRYPQVEFRLGEIENLPVADGSADVIISNCVINLSPDKERVFNEAFRVLRSGGRMAVSDIVAVSELPEKIKQNLDAISSCIGGAALVSDLEEMIRQAGFREVRITLHEKSRGVIKDWFPESGFENYVSSAFIEAVKE